MEVFTLNDNGYKTFVNMYRANPVSVEGLNNTSYAYYFNKLLKMVYSIFKFDNMPSSWDMPYFKEHLFLDGHICVTDTTSGVIPLQSGYSGLNVYGHATDFNIENIVLGNLRGKIGIDGVMLFLEMRGNGYQSLAPLITRYATLLAEVDGSLQTTLINSRVAHIFSANSQAQLKTMAKMYDQISQGKPAVFIRKTGLEEDDNHVIFNNVKNTYIGTELLDTKRTILNEFLTEIGINNANTTKRERLNTDEVNANNQELSANIFEWFTNLENGFNQVNELYGLNIKVSLNDEVLGGVQNELFTSERVGTI